MWPFGKRLRDQDAVEKYRRWLRRWLLGSWRVIAAGTLAAAILVGIVWVAVNTWDSSSKPAAGDKPAREVMTGSPPAELDLSTGCIEDRQVKQPELETNYRNEPGDSQAVGVNETGRETGVSSVVKNDRAPSLSLPVSGKKILSYGYHYSPLYDDYRFHTGIVLQTEGNNQVYPCMPGKVVEITVTENNGYTVTMDHGDGWASKYEGLAGVTAQKNSNLSTSDPLGEAKTNVDNQGEITFTLTRNGKAVDPGI